MPTVYSDSRGRCRPQGTSPVRPARLHAGARARDRAAAHPARRAARADRAPRDYIFLPDRAHPVAPLVNVAGGHEPKNGGGIYFVDVIVRKATLLEQLFGGLHNGADLYPADEIVPPGVSSAAGEPGRRSRRWQTSQQIAAAVALRALGRKVTISQTGALVDEVRAGHPGRRASSTPTDVIVAIDGKPVRSPGRRARRDGRASRSATTFSFTILRDGKRRVVVAHDRAPPSRGSKRGVVGDLPRPEPNETIHLPIHVSIDAARRRRPLGRARVRARGAAEARPQRRPRAQDRGDRRDLPQRPGRPDRRDQAEDDRRARGGCGRLPRPGGQNAADARKYAHGLRIIPVKNFQQALHALATLPPKRLETWEFGLSRKGRKLRVFSSGKPLIGGRTMRRIASRRRSPPTGSTNDATSKPTCEDCYFRRHGLCALALERPCPTFRAAERILEPPPPAAARAAARSGRRLRLSSPTRSRQPTAAASRSTPSSISSGET